MNYKKLFPMLVFSAFLAIVYIVFVANRFADEADDDAYGQQATLEKAAKDRIKRQRDDARREAEERELIRKLAPKSPELLRLKEGDVEGLEKEFREKSGLELRELRKNADGSYDLVAGNPAPTTRGEEPFLPEDVRELYREKYLKSANQGRVPSLDARDRQEVERFRKSLEPQ